ncbi:MAG: hypothetical protein WA840_16100 [Caulobacteraceae bacterium]
MKLLAHCSEDGRTVRVIEYKLDRSRLYFEGPSLYTHVDAEGNNQLDYVTAMETLLAGEADVLLLGTAGGALATRLSRRGVSVTAVDNWPAAFRIAREWFHLPPEVECVHADGLAFLKTTPSRWSAIAIDVFDGVEIPAAFFAEGVAATLLQALKPHGLIVWNVADSALSWTVHRLIKGLRSAGLKPTAFPVLSEDVGNTLVVCRKPPNLEQIDTDGRT